MAQGYKSGYENEPFLGDSFNFAYRGCFINLMTTLIV